MATDQAPDATVEALARAWHSFMDRAITFDERFCFCRDKAVAILAALPGYRLVPVEEWERLELVMRSAVDVVHTENCTEPLFGCPVCVSFHVRDCSSKTGKDQPHDTSYCGSEHHGAIGVLRAALSESQP